MDLNGSRQTLHLFGSIWLEQVIKPRCEPSTHEFYQRHLGYICTEIGATPLHQLDAQNIQAALNALAAKKLSPRTIAHIRAVLRNALATAVKWRYLTSNPAELTDAPRVPERADTTLPPEHIDALLPVVAAHRLGTLFETMILVGPRPIEMMELRWIDVDLATATINVADSKTPSGRRGIPLSSQLAAHYGQHWKNQQEERQLAGENWQDNGLVFPSERGTPILHSNLIRAFKSLLKRAGLPKTYELYDLRRTAISWWIETGADPRAAQQLAGHAKPDVTLGIYARSRLEAQRAIVEEADRRRRGA